MAFCGSGHIFLQKKSYRKLTILTPLPQGLRAAAPSLLRPNERQTLMWVIPLPPPLRPCCLVTQEQHTP